VLFRDLTLLSLTPQKFASLGWAIKVKTESHTSVFLESTEEYKEFGTGCLKAHLVSHISNVIKIM
jgi:hypothetical protein